MTSLYKRASPQQHRILRVVEGAVKNALHAHPGQQVRPNFARSVAKRAAGTLTAQWPEVLAAKPSRSPSESGDGRGAAVSGASGDNLPARRVGQVPADRGRRRQCDSGDGLGSVHRQIGLLISEAKRSGDNARRDALIDAIRIVGAMREKIREAA